MTDQPPLHLAELLGTLSCALDLGEGQPAGHGLRSCWIAMQLARELHLDDGERHDLYYTVLLADAGGSSVASRLHALFGTDDLAVKRALSRCDLQCQGQRLRFLITHGGAGRGLGQRLRSTQRLLRHGERLFGELAAARGVAGAEVARRLGMSERVATAIASIDEHWNGRGLPHGRRESAIPLAARIGLLARTVDVFHHDGGAAAALAVVDRRQGSWFEPQLVKLLQRLGGDEGFWHGLDDRDLDRRVAVLVAAEAPLDEARLDAIADAFAWVIDAKSPFTAGHSNRVANTAVAIAERLGIGPERTCVLRRGGLLHDLGMLGIGNHLLDKPGALTEPERAAMQQHAVLTEHVLGRCLPWSALARLWSSHHERIDGAGYPRGLGGEQIELPARIVAVADAFDALTTARPHRPAIAVEAAAAELVAMRGSGLDADCVDALLQVLALPAAARVQPAVSG